MQASSWRLPKEPEALPAADIPADTAVRPSSIMSVSPIIRRRSGPRRRPQIMRRRPCIQRRRAVRIPAGVWHGPVKIKRLGAPINFEPFYPNGSYGKVVYRDGKYIYDGKDLPKK